MMIERRRLLNTIVGSALLSVLVLHGCGGGGDGTVTNTNNNSSAENTSSNDAVAPTPCDDGTVDMFIDGVPEGQIGPDSTLLLSAVPCSTGRTYAYNWSWEGPIDEGDLHPIDEQDVMFNIFSPGTFTITVVATDMQSGSSLTTDTSFEAIIGGPPFSL